VRGAALAGLACGVVDQDVSGERVGLPPAEGGVEDQAGRDGGGQDRVDEGDAAFGS
jgi:hypothetical protein